MWGSKVNVVGTINRKLQKGLELPLNLAFPSVTVSPGSPLTSHSHQEGEDVSEQRVPLLAAA